MNTESEHTTNVESELPANVKYLHMQWLLASKRRDEAMKRSCAMSNAALSLLPDDITRSLYADLDVVKACQDENHADREYKAALTAYVKSLTEAP